MSLAWFTTFQFCSQGHGDSDCVLTKSRARLELSELTLGRGQCALIILALGYWDPVGCQLLTFSLALKVHFYPFPLTAEAQRARPCAQSHMAGSGYGQALSQNPARPE